MDAREVLEAVIKEMTKPEEKDCCGLMADVLARHGWYVAETDSELRDIAIGELGLVDPEG